MHIEIKLQITFWLKNRPDLKGVPIFLGDVSFI